MPSIVAIRRPSRVSFLTSAATALGLVCTGMPAAAQSTVSATGDRALANQQAIRGADQEVDAENSNIFVTTPAINASALRLDGNMLTMAAAGNQADDALSSDGLAASDPVPSRLQAGVDGVSADGALVIANLQSASDSITGTVPFGSTVLLDGGAVDAARVSTSGNSQEGRATANGTNDSIAAGDGRAAGIASYQVVDSLSQTAGRAAGSIDLRINSLTASQLASSDNVARGIGIGNDVETTLTASTGATATEPLPMVGPETASVGAGGDSVLTARYGILTNQSAAGLTKGRAGSDTASPAFRLGAAGAVADSSIAIDGNSLGGAAYANNAANNLLLEGASVSDIGGAAIADISDMQLVNGAVKAFTVGGAAADVGPGMTGSSVSLSDNAMRAAAAGNLASDTLSVKTTSVHGPSSESDAAAALVTPANGALLNAGLGVQTSQDFGTSTVSAWMPASATAITVAGPLATSGVTVDGNVRSAAASGNSATDSLTVEADDLASGGAVNLVQSGNGSVSATLGATGDLAGSRLTATRIDDGSASVSNNVDAATALGNDGAAAMTVAANSVSDAGTGQANSGALDDAYGATGAFALAANQKLGAPDVVGAVQPSVAASVDDRSGITALGGATRSALTVDDNSQRADALGNNGVNRLTVSATSLDGSAASGLSSSQFGQAAISATSSRTLVAPGTLVSSSAEMSGNDNVAYAAVNSADNGLSVDGIGTAAVAPSLAHSDPFGPPIASGDAALSNQQFAAGTLDARATSVLGAAGELTSSQLQIAGNTTLADAAANRALNAASAVGIAPTGVAMTNTQVNDATVHASAASDLRFTGATGQAAMTGSGLAVDGNTTSATARGNVADNEVTVSAGAGDATATSGGQAGSSSASASAPVTLLNQQMNLASVSADVGRAVLMAPLNGKVDGSRLSLGGNSYAATAYGNSATSSMTVSGLGAMPGAALVTTQSNSGSVSAVVTGATYRSLAGPIEGSAVSLSGNRIAAAATGNFAIGTITAP